MDLAAVKHELRGAIVVLQRRGLRFSAKWCAEILCGVCPATDPRFTQIRLPAYEPVDGSFHFEADAEQAEDDNYIYAKCLFDSREFARCAAHLDRCFGDASAFPPLAFFLRCYALYLVRTSV